MYSYIKIIIDFEQCIYVSIATKSYQLLCMHIHTYIAPDQFNTTLVTCSYVHG